MLRNLVIENQSYGENNKIRIMVADGSLLFCKRIATLIKSQAHLEYIAETTSYEETVTRINEFKPDVLLLDHFLIFDAVTEKIQGLKATSLASKILIHYQNVEIDLPIRCLRSGAVGMLLKNQNNKTILKAIDCVCNGELWAQRSLIAQILNEDWLQKFIPGALANQHFRSLTTREKTIANMAAQGMTSKKIASQLAISVKTVRNQLTVIYSKLGVKNHIGLILLTRA